MADFEQDLNYQTPEDLVGPEGLLSHLGVDASSSNPPVAVEDPGLLFESTGSECDFTIDKEVPASFTLEFSGVMQAMTVGGFQNPSQRHVYFSAQDASAHVGGLFLGPEGFANGQSWGQKTTPTGFPLSLGMDYTFRIVVNHEANQMHVYATPTAQVATDGHVLRYTVIPQATIIPTDRLYLRVLGGLTAPTRFLLRTYRYAKAPIMPQLRPIAVPGLDRVAPVDSVVRIDGTGSYALNGKPLGYAWSVTRQPGGSDVLLSSGTPALWQHSGVLFTSKLPGAQGNGQQIQIVSPPQGPGGPAIPLSITLEGGVITIALAKKDQCIQTTRQMLVNALSSKYDPAYNAAVSALVQAQVMAGEDPDAVMVVTTGTLPTLSGGSDGTAGIVTFTPEMEGLYEITLVVNDTVLDSLPASVVVRAEPFSQLLGEIPDAGYLWEYLSDFYAKVKNRGFYTTWWSAFIQTIAAQLLRLYQHDYAKSQASIQSEFVRRWLGYDLWWRFVLPKEDVTLVETTTFEVTPKDDADLDLDTAVVEGSSLPAVGDTVITPAGTIHFVRVSANGAAVLHPEIPAYTVVSAGNGAGYTYDPGEGLRFGTAYGALPAFEAEDVLRLDTGLYPIVGLTDGLYEVTGTLPDPAPCLAWQVWRPVTQTILTRCSRLDMGDDDPLTERKFEPGDLVTVRTGELEEHCPLLAVAAREVWFDASGLTAAFTTAAETTTPVGTHLRRGRRIPVDEFLSSIPRLQEHIKDPTIVYTENEHFHLEDERITFETAFADPPERLWAEVSVFDNDPTIAQNFGCLVGLPREAYTETGLDIRYLSAVRGLMFILFRGPSVTNVRIAGQIFCNLPFAEEAGTITLLEPNYDLEGQRGRFFIQSPDGRTRVYYYPAAAGVATNPSTGAPYALRDAVARFAPLCEGITVRDYVNAPTWWMGLLPEVRKVHVFEVRMDLSVASCDNVQLLSEYVSCLKPAWTDIVLMGVRVISDEMPLSEKIHSKVKIWLVDQPHTCEHNPPPPFKSGYTMRFDEYDGVGNWHPEETNEGKTRSDMGVMCADPMVSPFAHVEDPGNGNDVYPENWLGPGKASEGEADPIDVIAAGVNQGRYPTWADRSHYFNPRNDLNIRRGFYIPVNPSVDEWQDAQVGWRGPPAVLAAYADRVPPPPVYTEPPTLVSDCCRMLPRTDSIFRADAVVSNGENEDPPATWRGPAEVLRRLYNSRPTFTADRRYFHVWGDYRLIPGALTQEFPWQPAGPGMGINPLENRALCAVLAHDPEASTLSTNLPAPLPVRATLGGGVMSVDGYYFGVGAQIFVGEVEWPGVFWVNDKVLTVAIPQPPPAAGDVVVRNPDAQEGMLVDGYQP